MFKLKRLYNHNEKDVSIDLKWEAQEGKQATVFEIITTNCGIDECYYGGGKGCGKSEVGINATLKVMLDYGYKFNGLYIRDTYTSLNDIIARFEGRLREIGIKFRLDRATGIMKLPNHAQLRFFYADKGISKLDGGNYNYIVLEEPQYFKDIEMDIARLRAMHRTVHAGFPKKLVMFFNPYGNNMAFFKYQVMTHEDNVINVKEGLAEKGYTRVFIKGTVKDNPLLLKNDPTYMDRLLALSKDMREALLYGNIIDNNPQPFENKLKKVSDAYIDKMPQNSRVYATLDLAFGGKDSTALTIGYKTNDSDIVVLYGGIWNRHWENCTSEIITQLDKFEPDYFYYEAQKQNLTGLKRWWESFNIAAYPLWTGTKQSKEDKILQSATAVDTIYISSYVQEDYYKEVRNWYYKAKKDDAPDSFAMLVGKLGLIWEQ